MTSTGRGQNRDQRHAAFGMLLFAASVIVPGLTLTALMGFTGLVLIGRLPDPRGGNAVRITVLLAACCFAVNLAAGSRFVPRTEAVGDVLPLSVRVYSLAETLAGVALALVLATGLRRWSAAHRPRLSQAWGVIAFGAAVTGVFVLVLELSALAVPAWQDRIELAEMMPPTAPPLVRLLFVVGEVAGGTVLLAFFGLLVIMAVGLLRADTPETPTQ